VLLLSLGFNGSLLAQTPDFFENYPGGSTRTVYEITDGRLNIPARLTQEIRPTVGGVFEVHSNAQFQGRLDQLDVGLIELQAKLFGFLTSEAVRTLLEKVDEVDPIGTVLLTANGQFESDGEENFLGVTVIRGVLRFRDNPDRRLRLYLTQDKFVPLPPLLVVEDREGGEFSEDFKLELKEFIRES